jgi:hypothetical protein
VDSCDVDPCDSDPFDFSDDDDDDPDGNTLPISSAPFDTRSFATDTVLGMICPNTDVDSDFRFGFGFDAFAFVVVDRRFTAGLTLTFTFDRGDDFDFIVGLTRDLVAFAALPFAPLRDDDADFDDVALDDFDFPAFDLVERDERADLRAAADRVAMRISPCWARGYRPTAELVTHQVRKKQADYQFSRSIPIASAIISAMCRTRVGTFPRWHIPAMFIVHPASLHTVVAAPVAAMH